MKKNIQIHLIANSHLDPVWLWDWREGLNEGITTARTIIKLMEENKNLTYIRGEAAIYQHIEKHDPKTFKKIQKLVKSGRWDVVGGTYIQPDTNLASAETIIRHFAQAKSYFKSRFGKDVKVAWQADSFGHTAGLPEIFSAAGIESFAFSRPAEKDFHLDEPAFWWEGEAGAKILSYRCPVGWYGTDHDVMPERLGLLLEMAQKSKLKTVGCFYGLGNHGGGPSRRQIDDIFKWAKEHPEVEVIHSGLHPFFEALRKEIRLIGERSIPTIKGELNFCLRGCYSSMAKFKYLYRKAENHLVRAEKTDTAISLLTKKKNANLDEAWKGILFNSFHDILPGSSIERAFDDQISWVGGIIHKCHETELMALNTLASEIDTRVAVHPLDTPSGVSVLTWNPHSSPYSGLIEMEACLDYRAILKYAKRGEELPIRVLGHQGRPLPFQEIPTEHHCMPYAPWRKRVLVPVTLPAFGWNMLEMAWVEGANTIPVANPVRYDDYSIDNDIYRVEARVGSKHVKIFQNGKSIFFQDGLSFQVINDPWGSWGGMEEQKESIYLNQIQEEWAITNVELLEKGPFRTTLWVRFEGEKSRIDLFFSLNRERRAIDVSARLFWNERCARLKMVLPVGDKAEFEVPAGTVKRNAIGEVPGIGWVKTKNFGFTSDAIYNFNTQDGLLKATIVRATRYADDIHTLPNHELWRPPTDIGEHRFKFLMTTYLSELQELTTQLEQPPIVMLTHPHEGKLPRESSIAELTPSSLHLLALKPSENGKGYVVRVHVPTSTGVNAKLNWMGQKIDLGKVKKGEVISWLLSKEKDKWGAQRVSIKD